MFEMFEDMRRANEDFYTVNPLTNLDEETLARLAAESGMTVEELRKQMNTPHIEMTCPLCGQPSTHLVNCKGCGGDAFGGEFVLAYGEDVHARMKATFKAALTNEAHRAEMQEQFGMLPEISLEQVDYATNHAYAWGGCMICANCWHHTLPVQAYQTCPINLLGNQAIDETPTWAVVDIMMQFNRDEEEERNAAVMEFIRASWARWTVIWNTVADQEERLAVAFWRHLLLKTVWK